MMYEKTCAPVPVGECIPVPVENLTDLMKETNRIAFDVLGMSRRINGHLFGIGNPGEEKKPEPKCFRDELTNANKTLLETAEELSRICCMLGV